METEWITVENQAPDRKEPVVYARRKTDRSGWFVGIAYWTVSDRYNPEMESSYAPHGFTHWMPLPEKNPGEQFKYPDAPKEPAITEEVIGREDLRALLEYSRSIPTGKTIGKRWRCSVQGEKPHKWMFWWKPSRKNQEWLIRTYIQDPDDETMLMIPQVLAVIRPGVPHQGDLR